VVIRSVAFPCPVWSENWICIKMVARTAASLVHRPFQRADLAPWGPRTRVAPPASSRNSASLGPRFACRARQ
jgi:hypothetical protein